MKSVKRIITVLSAQVNDIVDQMENHEAVAQSALQRFRKDINEAKFQSKCMERELREILNKKVEAEKDICKWTERAKNYHETDKDKALECVRRMKQCEADVKFLKERELELEKVLAQLKSELRNVESRYMKMKQKHRMLASREKGAVMTGQLNGSAQALDKESINEVFERWEDKVTKAEIKGEMCFESADDFTQQVEREEENMDLEEALNELVNK